MLKWLVIAVQMCLLNGSFAIAENLLLSWFREIGTKSPFNWASNFSGSFTNPFFRRRLEKLIERPWREISF